MFENSVELYARQISKGFHCFFFFGEGYRTRYKAKKVWLYLSSFIIWLFMGVLHILEKTEMRILKSVSCILYPEEILCQKHLLLYWYEDLTPFVLALTWSLSQVVWPYHESTQVVDDVIGSNDHHMQGDLCVKWPRKRVLHDMLVMFS